MPLTPDQPHLNGAYYGPSIPPKPKPKTSHRPSRRGTTGTCNPLTCCFSCICSCIFNCIFQILITILIILLIICLILWFIFRPNVPKFHVNDVTLTQFTLSDTNSTLHYNLAVNMTFRNPNRRLGIYYDNIEANALYHGVRFGTEDVTGFYLGHKKENNVGAVFKGEQVVSGVEDKYEKEVGDGVYRIMLKLRLKIRFKVMWMKTGKFKPKFVCDLKVPLSGKGKVGDSSSSSSVVFERTKCDFDW